MKARPVFRITAPVAIASGLALNLIGFVWWEGPGRATSVEEYVARVGSSFRSDALTSLLSGVPGSLLAFLGIAALLRRRQSRVLGLVSKAITAVAVVSAVLTAASVVCGQIAVGTQDLDSQEFAITGPQWAADAWYPLFLRGLNAFALSFALCLCGLIGVAIHDASAHSETSVGSRNRLRIAPKVAIPLGIVLFIVGSLIFSFGADRPSTLDEYFARAGNLVRRDALVTLLLLMPGYALTFVGIARLLRQRSEVSPLLRFVSRAIVFAVVAEAVLDVTWVAIGLVASGTQNVESPEFVVTAPSWLVDAWSPVFEIGGVVFFFGLGLSLFGLVVGAVQYRSGKG